jgi:hypothetical protein
MQLSYPALFPIYETATGELPLSRVARWVWKVNLFELVKVKEGTVEHQAPTREDMFWRSWRACPASQVRKVLQ